MTTRPAGNSRYSVFCGSSARQSAAEEAASTSAVVCTFGAGCGAGAAAAVPRASRAASSGGDRRRCAFIGILVSLQAREAVRAPVLAPHAVVHDEEPFRVVLLLDGSEALVVRAEVRLLPALVEEVALRQIRPGARR